MNWLAKFAESQKSEAEVLHDTVATLPPSILQDLQYDIDPTSRPTQMAEMADKIANSIRMGTELAREKEIEKTALLGTLMGAAKGLMTGGPAGAIGGAIKGGVGEAASGAASKVVNKAMQPAAGAFNYGGKIAGVLPAGVGSLVNKGVGFLHQNPGAAMTLAGAGAGALMAPRDPQTGQKQYLRGAVMGGGLAAGANALSQGRMADKMKSMVTRQNNPVLGQGVRRSVIQSAYKGTRPGVGAAPSAVPSGAGSAGAAASTPYSGGPVGGQVKIASVTDLVKHLAMEKKANQQTLTYDPSTKTFIRQHVTPDTTMGNSGSDVIPAGHQEPVVQGAGGRGSYAGRVAPAGTPAGGGMSQVHSLHGGDVLSSSPGRGMMASAGRQMPPPIPAAARMAGPAGLAGAAAKTKLPSLTGAVSLARK